jgi:hypothetical protein
MTDFIQQERAERLRILARYNKGSNLASQFAVIKRLLEPWECG